MPRTFLYNRVMNNLILLQVTIYIARLEHCTAERSVANVYKFRLRTSIGTTCNKSAEVKTESSI